MAEERLSSYLAHLPALLQQEPFVGRFLLAFERLLSGLQPPDPTAPYPYQDSPGLEDVIGRLHTYWVPYVPGATSPAPPAPIQARREFLPWLATWVPYIPGTPPPALVQAPPEFLPWLASWVALSLREDWGEEEKRRLISRMVDLYRYRGTRRGLEDLLHTYTNEAVVITEFDEPAYYFQVEMTLSDPSPERRGRIERIARAIIDQEKPAHTFYALRILTPTMRILNAGEQDKAQQQGIWIGKSTFLGTTAGGRS